jgi:hypothetical protein
MNVPIAIPSLFGKPSYPTILLELLQREQPLRYIEKSGWRDSNRPLQIGAKKNPSPMKEMGLL